MAVIEGGTSAALAEVGVPGAGIIGANVAQCIQPRPVAYGDKGHYRLSYRAILATAQAANSRLFELRNTGTNLIVLTRLTLRVMQVAAGTAQENSLDCYRLTGFSAVDTTNTTTPVPSLKRTGMGASPGNVAIRGVTLAGAAAGMTGGTLVKDSQMFATLPFNVAAAISTTWYWGEYNCTDDVNGNHPFTFAQNEGFDVENRVLNVTSYGCAFYLDCSYLETSAY
jgi:hypothetical protein